MLNVENLTVEYLHNEKPSVEDFSLQMQPGEVISIVGESGSGKSTVIRAILGALSGEGRVIGGTVTFQGEDTASYTPEQWRQKRGTVMSMIFQDAGATLNPIRTIGSQFAEYIRTHDSVLSRKEARARAAEMLGRMRLPNPEGILKNYPFQLSGGMKQRVAIAMAMTFHPRLLLADEPTSALDVTTQAQIIRQMLELKESEGTAILMVTHNLGVAAYMSDRILVMKDGKIVETGTRREILEHPQDPYTKKLLSAVPSMRGERLVQ